MVFRSDWAGFFEQEALKGARVVCPHCDTATTLSPAIQHKYYDNEEKRFIYHAVMQCDNALCRKFVYVCTTKKHNLDQNPFQDQLTMFPERPIKQAHPAIPEHVADDWIEAQKAFSVGAIKAAAVMCRRVLYGIIMDRKCKEYPLSEGLKQLTSQERLPVVIEGWLTEIKDDGHDAAHPQRALEVPADNVTETMEYVSEILRWIYIEPFELKQRLVRKAATS